MEAGEILLRKGLLDNRQLKISRDAQNENTRLDQAAVQLGFLTEEQALRALGEEVGLDFPSDRSTAR
jgi:general secretion pathway protein E/type IV pilus assembly protein PilB